MSTPILEIKGVHQRFRSGFWMKEVEVLHDVSFSVPAHSVFGFLGPNGAGKTTLIHLITGLKKPPQGSVLIHGHAADRPEARALLGYLPERPYFYDHLSGRSVLRYFGRLSGMSHPELEQRIPIVLEEVGLSSAADRELRTYSKGMLQRIGIAQAIIHNPPFLVLDEPMSGLDPIGRKEIRQLILKLASQGRTIFFSSHVIPDVEAICDRIAVIRKGRITHYGPVGDFLQTEEAITEVVFSGMSSERASVLFPADLQVIPDGFRLSVQRDRHDLNGVLKNLVDQGARIHSVAPVRRSLEEVFG